VSLLFPAAQECTSLESRLALVGLGEGLEAGTKIFSAQGLSKNYRR